MTRHTVLRSFFVPALAALLAAVFVTVANAAGPLAHDGEALHGHRTDTRTP